MNIKSQHIKRRRKYIFFFVKKERRKYGTKINKSSTKQITDTQSILSEIINRFRRTSMVFKLKISNTMVNTLTIVFSLFVFLTSQIAQAKIHRHTFTVLWNRYHFYVMNSDKKVMLSTKRYEYMKSIYADKVKNVHPTLWHQNYIDSERRVPRTDVKSPPWR